MRIRKNKNFSLRFRETEKDIIYWINSLPKNTINKYMRKILEAEVRGKVADIPIEYEKVGDVEPMLCAMTIRDAKALMFFEKIPQGKKNDFMINVIRKHIALNQGVQVKDAYINESILHDVLDGFRKEFKDRSPKRGFNFGKNKNIQEIFDVAFKNLIDQISLCFKIADDDVGNLNLLNLDYKRIVDDAYGDSNGSINAKANRRKRK